jgi:soluble lytic murein transglycosylase
MQQHWDRNIRGRLFKAVGQALSLPMVLAFAFSALPLRAQTLEPLARAYREKNSPQNKAPLAAFAAAHPKDLDGALALLALGASEKLPAEAVRLLEKANPRLPKIADYTSLMLAANQLALKNYTQALHYAAVVFSFSPVSPLGPRTAPVAARAYLELGKPEKAIQILRRYAADLAQPAGRLLLAKCLEATHDLTSAAIAYQDVYYQYPGSPEAPEADIALLRLSANLGTSYPPPMGPAMLGRVSKLMLRSPRLALNDLERFIPLLGGADRETAQVRVGEAEFRLKEVDKATRYLATLPISSPEADAERLYHLYMCARRIDNESGMKQALAELSGKHPKSPWRLNALVNAGEHYLLTNDYRAYEPLYKACYENFASSPQAPMCHWKYVWSAYLRRRAEAGDKLREHVKLFPDSEKANTALYFLGRLSEEAHDIPAANTYYAEVSRLYANTYYAMLSRDREKTLKGAAESPQVAAFLRGIALPAVHFDTNMKPTAETQSRIDRSRLLGRAGLIDYLELELRFGARSGGQVFPAAMELASVLTQRGMADKALRYMKNLIPNYLYLPPQSVPEQFWQLLFPLPFRVTVEQHAQARALDPFVVAGLIRQESEFNPKVISYANAYGLTQIMPATGKELSRRLGLKGYSTASLFRPEINIQLGAYYLRSLLNSLNNHWEATLASYNAGKSRADKWMAWERYREPAEFIETIPFTQTRDYVQAVMRNANMYRWLYEGKPSAVPSINEPARKPDPSPAARNKKRPAAVSKRPNR